MALHAGGSQDCRRSEDFLTGTCPSMAVQAARAIARRWAPIVIRNGASTAWLSIRWPDSIVTKVRWTQWVGGPKLEFTPASGGAPTRLGTGMALQLTEG